MRYKLGVWSSHPVQYYTPWFRALAAEVDLEVLFGYRQTPQGQSEAGFGVDFEWDVPLLEGYRYRWLRNTARRPSVGRFAGCDNPELYGILGENRFDALLVFGWYLKGALQAVHAAWRRGIPVLMRGDSQLQTPRSLLKRTAKYPLYRWLLPRIPVHLYVGTRNRTYLQHYGVSDEQLFFAPHFVDNTFFRQEAGASSSTGQRERLREQYGIPQDAFLLLFVGKLVPQKRVDDILQACTIICSTTVQVDVHVLLVGDGPQRRGLEQRSGDISERIHFAGFQNQAALPAIYAAADVLVLPSGTETWGLVVNEAMAAGIPAIVSDAIGCAPDLIELGRTGFTYPVGNVPALADRILECYQLRTADPVLIETALKSKLTTFSMTTATQGVLEALKYTLKRGNER